MSIKDCPRVPITDVLSFIVDNRGKTVPTAETGTPLIATNCILNERLYPVFENIRYVSDDVLQNWFRAHLKPHDILFVNKGTPGRCCLVPDPVTFCAAQDMIGLRCNAQKIYYRYLLMVLRSAEIQKTISNNHVGLVIPHFKKENLPQLMIPVPEMEEQKALGDLYFQLCEKIENNNAICSNLEAMAKLLYDYWFVQFDFPDENGKPYKSSGGKMAWNDELKREIPAGWEVNRLGDLISYSRGVSYTGNDMCDSGTPIISLASIDRSGRYIPDGIKYYNQDYPSSKVLKPYDLVMANTDMTQERAVMGKIIFVPDIFEGDILSTHHITKIVIADDFKSYLMMTTQTDWFHKYIKGFSSGTNVLGMDMVGFEDYMLLCPSKDVLIRFNSIIHNIYKKIFEVSIENQQLASLRDFLLPMLMNGQVKVGA